MGLELFFAIFAITAALIFYTSGVFLERKSRVLKKNHVIIFWIGLIFDILGTTTMSLIAKSGTYTPKSPLVESIHGITGSLAIVLMLFHAAWAIWVLYKDDIIKKQFFHRFSVFVWSIWLIPYFVGMMIGMIK